MHIALGENDKKIYVIPSKRMVVIPKGDVANQINPTFTISDFDEILG